ncbi:ABC transporter G family member 41-like [Panicum miliaceum]|uniref:ABC transporter G family member 41-like n=1 Tax=Panicum miliaceum TaxID=4540 RepID=A0A3L6PTS5_PANMI|nr:ABC transporter G family member 41-like [Panicum miliaceum]
MGELDLGIGGSGGSGSGPDSACPTSGPAGFCRNGGAAQWLRLSGRKGCPACWLQHRLRHRRRLGTREVRHGRRREKKRCPFEEPLLADEGDAVAARLGRRRQFLLPLQLSSSTLPKQGEMMIGSSKALFMYEISTGLDSSTTFQEKLYTMVLEAVFLIFFELCGFKCPRRKGAADFLQEVLSKKDQEQFWGLGDETYNFVTVDQFCERFKTCHVGQNLAMEILKPQEKAHNSALSFSIYSLSKWKLLKVGLVALLTGTVFLRGHLSNDRTHANSYMSSLFFALIFLIVNGLPEMAMTINRLPVFYKQRDCCFYPAWAYAIPAFFTKIPVSLVESVTWTCISYYLIGYTPQASRFFGHLLVLFLMHSTALSLFRCVVSYCQTAPVSSIGSTLSLIFFLLCGGFVIPRTSIPNWLKWVFWISPMSYGEISLTGNEFLTPRWEKVTVSGVTLGKTILMDRGLYFSSIFYWISVGALIVFILLLNIGFAIGLTTIRRKTFAYPSTNSFVTGKVIPFKPLAISFRDVNYYVDTPMAMREKGYAEGKLQLLHNITGSFQPGVLSVLTGAGKTTLLDVLAGRKTGVVIEGDIRIGGYPKVQETFARISGYCEQIDVHSPQITVWESGVYSAWLRLPAEIDPEIRHDFVKEVLETIELDEVRDTLVGLPGTNGLSTEQRKRLTVELSLSPTLVSFSWMSQHQDWMRGPLL